MRACVYIIKELNIFIIFRNEVGHRKSLMKTGDSETANRKCIDFTTWEVEKEYDKMENKQS